MWTKPDQIHVTGQTLHGFMLTAARNRSIDILRKKSPDPLDGVTVSSSSNLGKLTEHWMMCETFLALLDGDLRALIEMAYLKEMTHAEIASATGWPLGTIKSRIRRALGILKAALAANNAMPVATTG